MEYPLIGVIYNWKGLKEENYLYTPEELKERDPELLERCLKHPVRFHEGNSPAPNKTIEGRLLGDEERLKKFLNGFYNDTSRESIDPDWYWENSMEEIYGKTKYTEMMSVAMQYLVTLEPTDFVTGFSVDETFCIKLGQQEIGRAAISEMYNSEQVCLEWIEFYPEYKGKHLLRPALLAISSRCQVNEIYLESSQENMDKYIHLGAVKTEYDEFREMQGLLLSVDALEKVRSRTEEHMKFVDFEDIYVNNEGGMDYWVICNSLPQKYVEEAKEIDGENYNENCFGLIVTYGCRDGQEENEWFIDSDAPFYVDNDGNWNYLDYALTEEEKAEVIQMCKDEMNRVQELESLKEKLTKVMDELMQNNLPCNYVIVQNGTEEYVKNIYALDAYMKAYEMSKLGDIECYMAALGKENKAAHPVFSVKNGEITLSGQKITVDAAMLIPAPIKRRGR